MYPRFKHRSPNNQTSEDNMREILCSLVVAKGSLVSLVPRTCSDSPIRAPILARTLLDCNGH